MRNPVRSWSFLLIGLGVGAAVGTYLDSAPIWWGIVIALAGVGLSFIGSEPPTLDAASASKPASEPPGLAGLGTRVEQVLRLAEEQADDHRSKARRDGERILSAARSEAHAILQRARTEAAELTGIPKTEADGRQDGDARQA